MIIDGHNRIFPPLDAAAGFSSFKQKSNYIQRQFGGHHIPVWKTGDRTIVDKRSTLLNLDNYQLNKVDWNSELGRLNWTYQGETYTNQYLPPSLSNQECTPELLIREMDFAGIDMGILHPAPIFGRFNQYILDSALRFPDRFMPVFNIDDGSISNNPESAINEILSLIQPNVKCAVQFFSRWYYSAGNSQPWDNDLMSPYWDILAKIKTPVYFTLYNGGNRAREFDRSSQEAYLEEHRILGRWMEKYPDVKVVITHGPPWLTFMDDKKTFSFPKEFWDVFKSPNCHLQIAPVIMLGSIMEYPWKESEDSIKECVDKIGSTRLIWGTDMPLTLRFATYRQALNQFQKHCSFLNDNERKSILGGNAARVMGIHQYSN